MPKGEVVWRESEIAGGTRGRVRCGASSARSVSVLRNLLDRHSLLLAARELPS